MERQIYLENRAWQDGLALMMEKLAERSVPKNEFVDVRSALHRITGTIIRSKRSSPHFAASAMDGYAIRAKDTHGISEREPHWLELGIQAIQVDTGDPIPEGMDAVVMIEEVLELSEKGILLQAPVVPWNHVRPVGEDIVEGEVLLPIHHRIRPQDQGALLAAGLLEVEVRIKPRVGIIPTGDEIRPPEATLQVGDIVDSNSTVLASLVEEWGGTATISPIIPDQPQLLEEAILKMAASQDILVIIAGSSQGRDDYTSQMVQKFGTLYLHGVAIKPGKPVVLGEVQGKPAIGIPGYPVSAYLTAHLFLEPWVKHLQGLSKDSQASLNTIISKKVFSSLGSEEFVRVKVGRVGERWVAAPLSRGAGVTMSLVRADGILRVPRLQEGFHEGETVPVELLRPVSELEDTLVCIGSHDLTLDVLSSHMKARGGQGGIASAHVGSLAGILSLRKGEAHFAGIHLLDPETGEYNRSYLQRFLPGRDVALINLVYRTQVLIVPKGNPLNIKTLEDLVKPGVRFINRQGGSGTRVLLDYLLQKKGISKEEILGYEREEFTHLAIAVAVASGAADVGLGIQSAAEALGLDYVLVGEERYDLVVPREYLDEPRMKAMISVIQSKAFQEDVMALGGYDVRETGKFLT
ncbi:molybdopterin biosynthesis enzyme [Desulfosporosinus orientis DSM 765]|uniref:Molybdopterin molybdenumtransferase n=1 Tax=Desulfosporosinus orientis (strain ATCC 19365 / DSM 765 / NCIMB 8382 / VKM B-1628 / Singapore I) TaxID=768706 RepID=G7WER0_DESOD|nr:molybdopterin biosynthesis protein [Desulfosporosinus orientis]AET66951.1 molybdopterin biosynthesis enzyme [Desulfosporosinus orientis DSM 765]